MAREVAAGIIIRFPLNCCTEALIVFILNIIYFSSLKSPWQNLTPDIKGTLSGEKPEEAAPSFPCHFPLGDRLAQVSKESLEGLWGDGTH